MSIDFDRPPHRSRWERFTESGPVSFALLLCQVAAGQTAGERYERAQRAQRAEWRRDCPRFADES